MPAHDFLFCIPLLIFFGHTFEQMKKQFSYLIVVLIFFACNISKYQPAPTALQAGREFIDACLKGDFDKADFYMADDSTNNSYLLNIETDYHQKTADEKIQYGKASINIIEDAAINDSTHIINYKNSYDNIGRKVKVVNSNGIWLVDFKYTFDGNL